MIDQMALLERFRLQELLSLRTERGCSGCLLGLLRLLRLLGAGEGCVISTRWRKRSYTWAEQ